MGNDDRNASFSEPGLDLEMELEKMMEEGLEDESVGMCTQTQVDGVHSGVFGSDHPNMVEASVAGGSALAEDLLPGDEAQTRVDMFAESASQALDSWRASQDVSLSQQVPARAAAAADVAEEAMLDTELDFLLTRGFQNGDTNAGAGQEMDPARWDEEDLELEEELERIIDDAVSEAP